MELESRTKEPNVMLTFTARSKSKAPRKIICMPLFLSKSCATISNCQEKKSHSETWLQGSVNFIYICFLISLNRREVHNRKNSNTEGDYYLASDAQALAPHLYTFQLMLEYLGIAEYSKGRGKVRFPTGSKHWEHLC